MVIICFDLNDCEICYFKLWTPDTPWIHCFIYYTLLRVDLDFFFSDSNFCVEAATLVRQ